MGIETALIDRLAQETGERMIDRARAGRLRALERISCFAVTLTRDGMRTWEEFFDQPPTIGQIAARCGPQVFVISVRLRQVSQRHRPRLALAAE